MIENDAMLEAGIARMHAAGRIDGLAHAETRPPVVEDAAVALVLALAAFAALGGYLLSMGVDNEQRNEVRELEKSLEICTYGI